VIFDQAGVEFLPQRVAILPQSFSLLCCVIRINAI
jgi:hypothetical protein